MDTIVKFVSMAAEADEHYFEVERIGINKENTDLLDAKKVHEYLSFVAPVPYKNTLILRNQIYSHAMLAGQPIIRNNAVYNIPYRVIIKLSHMESEAIVWNI